jgi:hypothetical protein
MSAPSVFNRRAVQLATNEADLNSLSVLHARPCRIEIRSVSPIQPRGLLITKLAPIAIAIGLLMTTTQASTVFARGGGIHSEDPWDSRHVEGLPTDVRAAVARICGGARARHEFASYFHNFVCRQHS